MLVYLPASASGQEPATSSLRLIFPWWLPITVVGAVVFALAVVLIKPPPARAPRIPWLAGHTILLALAALLLGGWIAERRIASMLPSASTASTGALGQGTGQPMMRVIPPGPEPGAGALTFVTIVAAVIGGIAVLCLTAFVIEARDRDVRIETHWGGLGGGAGGWKLSPALLYLALALVLFSMLTVIATRALASTEVQRGTATAGSPS
jgi:hypothetical protein